jgi:hypothetical protein
LREVPPVRKADVISKKKKKKNLMQSEKLDCYNEGKKNKKMLKIWLPALSCPYNYFYFLKGGGGFLLHG